MKFAYLAALFVIFIGMFTQVEAASANVAICQNACYQQGQRCMRTCGADEYSARCKNDCTLATNHCKKTCL